jgi:1-deoxy-D-xylulose-5-phosphate reductoisomerase
LAVPTRVCILGSTGSIGRSALEVIRHYPGRFEVVGLAARANADLLASQIAEFRPSYVAVVDEGAAARLAAMGFDTAIWKGKESLERIASVPADVTLCAMVGAAGLRPVLSAIEAGNRLALANKEPLVMAGPLIMQRARERDVKVIPVDSEHNAIFQCLHGHRITDVRCVHLTASGGPFYGRAREALRDVTPGEATRHPTWNMGEKISVDSATLMNKGLEVIEAMSLFRLPLRKIEVIIHPQSIVHSLVEFNDGSILGHLGVTDMRFPILFALTWPERVQSPMGRLSLTTMRELTFGAPDFAEFPCLAHALRAADAGGTAPALLNAANEVAVEAFCSGHIGFLQIEEVVRHTLDEAPPSHDVDLEAIEAADASARRIAWRIVERMHESRNESRT